MFVSHSGYDAPIARRERMEIFMLDEVRDLRDVGETFLQALANRDFEAMRACLQQDVSFRALVPPGVRQAMDASGSWEVIEQRLYCDVGDDGRISTIDLLCSGFLPE
jgi:hypothetical protein